ncbi:MAG: hypothetical protein ACMX3H_17925 [Sodalis sp. (in: enterobacteria)]
MMVMNQFGIPAGLIAMFNTSPLVITLGMLSVAQAVALILSGGVPIYDVPAPYIDTVGYGTWLGLPVMVWIAVALTLFIGVLLKYTLFGRYVYAMCSNVSAASKVSVRPAPSVNSPSSY